MLEYNADTLEDLTEEWDSMDGDAKNAWLHNAIGGMTVLTEERDGKKIYTQFPGTRGEAALVPYATRDEGADFITDWIEKSGLHLAISAPASGRVTAEILDLSDSAKGRSLAVIRNRLTKADAIGLAAYLVKKLQLNKK
jgi:hypothetical protein